MSSHSGWFMTAGPDPKHPRHAPRGGPRIPTRTKWKPPAPDAEPDTTDDQAEDKEETLSGFEDDLIGPHD